MSAQVECIRFGEIIEIRRDGNWVERTMVLHHCGQGGSRAWFCQSCQYSAPNRTDVAAHCKQDGTHRIASVCPLHRWYEEAPPKKAEAVTEEQTEAVL